jgi:hypothetical protein
MSFLNAVGYDDEFQGMQMVPTRIKVRELVWNNLAAHPDKLAAWRKYYEDRPIGEYTFIHFALSMSPDYPFRRIRPRTELWSPELADQLTEFPDALNDFWKTAHLQDIWDQLKPDYMAEMAKYDFGRMSKDMTTLWEYLGLKRTDKFMVVQVPDLLNGWRRIYCAQDSHSSATASFAV